MEIAVIILGIVVFFLICILVSVKRQVKDICRQLAFIRKHDSNKRLGNDMRILGFNKLTDEMNAFVDDQKERRAVYLKKEQTISETYTNLSHDIRTPLTSLDGYFQLLHESDNEADKVRYIGIIQERIDSLNSMLEELFTFTKLKSDNYVLEMGKCNLTEILKKSILSYYDEWSNAGMTPVIELPDEALYVNANEVALKRVIQNIIKNVLVHGKNEIQIQLRTTEEKKVELRISNPVEHPEEIDASQVFERFYKADKARSKNSNGLGLAIAYELVQKMDGEIYAKVQGDVFSIVMVLH